MNCLNWTYLRIFGSKPFSTRKRKKSLKNYALRISSKHRNVCFRLHIDALSQWKAVKTNHKESAMNLFFKREKQILWNKWICSCLRVVLCFYKPRWKKSLMCRFICAFPDNNKNIVRVANGTEQLFWGALQLFTKTNLI